MMIKYINVKIVWSVLGIHFSLLIGNAQADSRAVIQEILPSGVDLGMSLDEVQSLRKNLMLGSKPKSKDNPGTQFFLYSEVSGMHKPGATSYYYFFTENELEGVIKTRSMDTLEEEERKLVLENSAKNIFFELGDSETEMIVRRTGNETRLFAPATLDKWSLISGEKLNVFHVATTREVSIGVTLADTKYPMEQIFLSTEDPRFAEYLEQDSSTMDTDRSILLGYEPVVQREKKSNIQNEDSLRSSEKNDPLTLEKEKLDPIEKKSDYTVWIVLSLLVIFGVLFKLVRK